MAVSNAAVGGDLFTRAVNTALDAVLKLVISGVSIYDIVLNPAYIVPDSEECKGMLMEEALGVFYLENALSLCSLGFSVGKGMTRGSRPEVFMAAAGMTTSESLKDGSFRKGDRIYKIVIPKDEFGIPDFKFVLKLAAQISINFTTGNLTAARLVNNGVAKTRNARNYEFEHCVQRGVYGARKQIAAYSGVRHRQDQEHGVQHNSFRT